MITQSTNSFESASQQTKLLKAVRRQFKRAVLTFVLVGMVFAAAVVLWPRSYRSEGKLFIRPTVKPLAEDPTATKEYQIGVASDASEFEVNSVVHILKSRRLAEAIVDRVGPMVILNQVEFADSSSAAFPSTVGREGTVSTNETFSRKREAAIRALMKSLSVTTPKKSTVIDIRCDTWSPELSQQIVASLMELYLQEHVRVNRVDGSYSFFQEQVELLERELADVNEQLRSTKSENALASIEGKRASLEQQLTVIELQITENQRQKSASEATIQSLRQTIERLPESVTAQNVDGLPNNAADAMRAELFRQEARLADLSSKYTDSHPEVQAAKDQVLELQRIMQEQAPQKRQVTTGRSPERQTLTVNMLAEQAALDAAEARLERLHQQHALVLKDLRELNAAEVRIADLQRQMQLADSNYRNYAQKLEQARMHNALETERISNIKVVQPATLVKKAVSPNKLLLAVVGLFLATVLAIAVAVVSDRSNSVLTTREDVEQHLELPVLASIPRTKQPEVSLN